MGYCRVWVPAEVTLNISKNKIKIDDLEIKPSMKVP
jgi:hypothetical protein